ncbi:serine/threonine protein kinase [Kibdelosporangium banguiense]|uniref:non-specific serine/threonine protein kinase n=1 Tax=Kibdelosporangium banguiense TaxID=1365924 RepID=A0ABS4U1J0_9PSEU|nr:serine/threonine-protein kinase [Kibdelosporangium banguiense]MBP2330523.1 serine/threonine protein kinase [Kibdelosporangium banguiense]
MRLPGYSDFQALAEGGEGTVYRARQDGLDRFVAVKVINVDDPSRVARFRRELEITVRLGRQHPHIVTVLDTGTAPDGRPCIVMEYYDLGSLHNRLREYGPLPVGEVIAVGVAVADALAFAHGQGFLHRDVKPQNILILPTSYVLADFGIARMADAGHTTSLQMVSYRHAAPQMVDGQTPAAVDDLWSLGSTLFTLLEGVAPFASDNPDEDTMLSYLGRLRSSEPRPLRRQDVPLELREVISRCLRKERGERYPDAMALRAALTAIKTETQGWTPSLPQGPSEISDITVQLPDQPTVAPTDIPQPEWFSLDPPKPVDPEPLTMPTVYQPVQPEAPQLPKRKRGRTVVFTALALLAGGAIGVAAVFLNNRDPGTATPPPATTTVPVPSTVTSAPSPSLVNDPAFAPKITALEDNGTTIKLQWSDPSGGKAQFVVLDVTGPKPQPLRTIAAGTRTFTVDGLDRGTKQYCYQVLAIGLNDPANERGVSERSCTDR